MNIPRFLDFLFPLLVSRALLACPSEFPTEVDTVVVGRQVTLRGVSGEICKAQADGKLEKISSGAIIQQGEKILVTSGASFAIGRTQFGPENHANRWVVFK